MEKFKHKYIFYFYPNYRTRESSKGLFRYYGRVQDGKANAVRLNRKYDYEKIY